MDLQLTQTDLSTIIYWADKVTGESRSIIFPAESATLKKIQTLKDGGQSSLDEFDANTILAWAESNIGSNHGFALFVSFDEYMLLEKIYKVLSREQEFENLFKIERRKAPRRVDSKQIEKTFNELMSKFDLIKKGQDNALVSSILLNRFKLILVDQATVSDLGRAIKKLQSLVLDIEEDIEDLHFELEYEEYMQKMKVKDELKDSIIDVAEIEKKVELSEELKEALEKVERHLRDERAKEKIQMKKAFKKKAGSEDPPRE